MVASSAISSQSDSFGGVEGVALVKLQHQACAIEIKLSWLNKLVNTYTIVGELGTITGGIEEWDKVTINYNSGKVAKTKLPSKEITYDHFGDKMLTNFIDVVGKGLQPLVAASEVIPSIELMEECYERVTRFRMPWYESLEVPNGR